MTSPNPPELRKNLLPPKPEEPPKPKTKSRRKKTSEPEAELSAYDLALDDLSNFGPILCRARQTHGDYTILLKGEQSISFHRASWTSSGDDSFITLYRKAADHWQIIDISVDDISTVNMTVKDLPTE